ncbi:BON domain-containing protein [Candidatus Nitrospira bockiana]
MKGIIWLVTFMLMSTFAASTGAFIGNQSYSDEELQAALKRRLAMDAHLDPASIHVKVKDGHVTLEGTVPTLADKAMADGFVASTVGVRAVTNALVVRPPVSRDEAIREQVQKTLETVLALRGTEITPSVVNGVVTLKGSVERPRQSKLAEKAVETVEGVVQVVNLLKVVGKGRPDREIEQDVLFYLQSSSLVDLDDVEYQVQNGMVKLKGTIDALSHKYALASDLDKIHGVRGVDVSELKVQPKGVALRK